MMKKRLLAMLLVLSMVVTLLPATALAAEGTPDCYIESSDSGYTGYNWMGADPAAGDRDVYVHIVGNVPDGWTMVGGKWTGASDIDISNDANRFLAKADCDGSQFTKSLTQTNKVSVGKNVSNQDVTIYRLTVDHDGALEAGEYRVFLESATQSQYYVLPNCKLSISGDSVAYSLGEIELPLEISPESTSVSFSCTVNLNGVNPDEVTFELREGSVNGTRVGYVSGRALTKSQRTGGRYEFRGAMPVSNLKGGTDLYLCLSHKKLSAPDWYSGPTTYVVPEGGAGQFILYGAAKDTTGNGYGENFGSTYEKAVPDATYCLTDNGDTTHTFLISGSSLSNLSKLSVEGGTLVTDSLRISMKNGVYTVTGGVTVSGSAKALVFNYDGQKVHSINFDRTKLAGVKTPYVTGAELGRVYENGDFTVKLSGFNLGSDVAGYSGVNYAEETYTCTSLTESNGIYTLRFKPAGTFSNNSVNLRYNGNSLETPSRHPYGADTVPVYVEVSYPNIVNIDSYIPDDAKKYDKYVCLVKGNQNLTIYGKGFDSNAEYTACFVPHTSEGFSQVTTRACTIVSENQLTVNAASVGTGWYTVYIMEGDTVIPRFQDVALYEDVSAPQMPEITVNDGKGVTTSQTIALSIDGGDYTEVRVAESLAALASAEWQAANSLTSYTLSEGYGEKTLYFEFRTANNETYSETARVTYSNSALPGAEYGISGAEDGNKVYIGNKYTLFIKYTGTGYVKGQAAISDGTGNVRDTIELSRISTVGTTSTYTGKTDFAATDKQIVFSLLDANGAAVSAKPMAVTVAEDLVISNAKAPLISRDSNYLNSMKFSYTPNCTLEFNGTPGKTATAVFAFDVEESHSVTMTEDRPGHYLFDDQVPFPSDATKLISITYHLTGEPGDIAKMRVFEKDEYAYERPYSSFKLSPSLTIKDIPEVYQSGNSYLEITPKGSESGLMDYQTITGASAAFKYLDKGTTYVCKLVMDGIVMRSWEVTVNGDTTYDYTTGEPVGTVQITMDITPPGGAAAGNYRYVNCVYVAADGTKCQFSLPCNGTKTLPKQGTLAYEVNMSSGEKLTYRPIAGTVDLATLSADSHTITATTVERNYHEITGTVTSMLDKSDTNEKAVPLKGAAVLVTQSLTDDPSACIVNRATTDIYGNYEVSVCDDFPVTITFSRYDHEAFQDTVARGTATYDCTMQYDKKNLIIPKLVVRPIEDPEFEKDAEDGALPAVEVTTDQLKLEEVIDGASGTFFYQNTILEYNNKFRSAVALAPAGNESAYTPAYPNKSLKLRFALDDERFVLENNGEITVTTDVNSTAVAELTATYKGYLRLNTLGESDTVYMLVFDETKYTTNPSDAYVGMAYGSGMVTTEDLHLDAGKYKVFVFKGSGLSTNIRTLSSANLLQQYMNDGTLNSENCTQQVVDVKNGKITSLEEAIPQTALTADALCSIHFETEQTATGNLRVKFYIDKVPEGQRVYDINLTQPGAPDDTGINLTDIQYYTGFGQDELPSGEFCLVRHTDNKVEGILNVHYSNWNSSSKYTITVKISETLPTPHISLETPPFFSTEQGKIDVSGQTEPNTEVTLRIGGLEAGKVLSDARGHYAATLQVSGAENGSIYPITATVTVEKKPWTAQSRIAASTNKIEVLNIETHHHNSFTGTEEVTHVDNLYSHNQAQSQTIQYYPNAPTTVSFQLSGCKREAFDSVWLITYDKDDNEDKVLRANCTGYDDEHTSNWEVTGNLGYYSSMGIRYFFDPNNVEDDLYELVTGQQLPDLSDLLNAAAKEDLKSNTINLAEAPNVIRKHVQPDMIEFGTVSSRSAAYTYALSDEGTDGGEADDTSFAYTHNLGGEDTNSAGQLKAEISMATPMTEEDLKEAGYLKMDTQQGSVWIKQEVVDSSEDSDSDFEVTYARSMYFSPEISKAAGLSEAGVSPVTTYNARSATDRALEGIDFVGNLQGGADFFHSLNGEMAEQFKNTTLGSQGVGTAVTVLGAVGTAVKIVSGPSREDPDTLRKMILLVNDSDTRKRLYGDVQDYIKLSDDLYYTDCVGSSVLTGISFMSNSTPVTKGATLFGGIAFGAINSWTADEIKTIYASIERSILAELQLQECKLGREFRIPGGRVLIDPSGYVFEAVEDNRVEGVTATVFEVDVSGKAVAWTDNWAGQENPQTTGSEGRYGWDVPTGTWKVSFDKEGYQHAESKTMEVYPAHTEVNIGLLSTAVPKVKTAAIVDNKLEVEFSMYMQADTSSCAITVYDEDMQIVPGTVSFPKAVANTGYKDGTYQKDVIAAETFTRWATFTPSDDYVGGFHDGETYTVKVSKNALSYAGVPMAADYIEECKISSSETPEVPVIPESPDDDNGGGNSGGGNSGGGIGGGSSSGGGSTSAGDSNVSSSGASTTVTPSAATKGDTASATISSSVGSSIVNQAVKNDSQTVVITPEVKGDVSKVEVSIPASVMGDLGSKTDADLTISTPVADVSIPNDGLSGLARQGGNVTVTTEKSGSTVELTVTAGGTTVDHVDGGVTLTVPYEKIVPGTVAVLVKEDGTREVIRKSVADEGEVVIPLDGSAVVEIIDNRKVFTDTAGHWAGDAIDFVTAHELYAGTSATTFAPNTPMSRGMLARVLHNLESNPDHTFTGAFSDLNGHWATDSILWAADRGIVGGYPNGTYGADDDISREQLAVMLWRYAGSPMTNHSLNHFTDVNSISGYARTALAWANENGIVGGIGNNVLDPQGKATRAQVAAMLMRMMLNT